MTAIAIGSIFAITLVGIVWLLNTMPRGCDGSCRQGRDKCICKGEQK
jgi:hypothetical protein